MTARVASSASRQASYIFRTGGGPSPTTAVRMSARVLPDAQERAGLLGGQGPSLPPRLAQRPLDGAGGVLVVLVRHDLPEPARGFGHRALQESNDQHGIAVDRHGQALVVRVAHRV